MLKIKPHRTTSVNWGSGFVDVDPPKIKPPVHSMPDKRDARDQKNFADDPVAGVKTNFKKWNVCRKK
jgi:hypothetical protein